MIWRKAAPSLLPPRPPNPPRDPLTGVRPAPGLEHQAPGWGGCGDGSVRLSSAPHPSAWVWVKTAPCWVFKPGLCRLARHGMARHGHITACCIPTDSQVPSHRWEEEEEGGCKRYPSHLPARRCNNRPQELAANPRMSPGARDRAGKSPSSPPPHAHPGERAGADSLFARAGLAQARWSRVGTVGARHPPCQGPSHPRHPLLSPPGCSHPRRLQDAREKRFSRR